MTEDLGTPEEAAQAACACVSNPCRGLLLPLVEHGCVQLLRALEAHKAATWHGGFCLAQICCNA